MLIGVPAPEAVINLINLFDEFEIKTGFYTIYPNGVEPIEVACVTYDGKLLLFL